MDVFSPAFLELPGSGTLLASEVNFPGIPTNPRSKRKPPSFSKKLFDKGPCALFLMRNQTTLVHYLSNRIVLKRLHKVSYVFILSLKILNFSGSFASKLSYVLTFSSNFWFAVQFQNFFWNKVFYCKKFENVANLAIGVKAWELGKRIELIGIKSFSGSD